MSIDLMGMFKDAVGQQIKGKLSGMLGMDDDKTSTAFDAVSGSVLGGLIKKSKDGGGAEIFEAAEKTDSGMLDKLDDLLGGGDQTKELEKQGGGLLEMIFGSGGGDIISKITKALGLGEGAGGSLMKMIAPLLISFIGKQLKAKAMDAVGMGKLLDDQSQHLGNYMPAGLTSQLGLGDVVSDAGEAVSKAGAAATEAAGDAAEAGGSLMKFLLPILLLGLAALALWLFVFKPMVYPKRDADYGMSGKPTPEAGTETESDAIDYMQIDGVDAEAVGESGSKLAENLSKVEEQIRNLTDESAASTVVESINSLSSSVDEMKLGELPDGAKSSVSAMITKFLDRIASLTSDIENDTIKALIDPVIESMSKKLKSFTSS